ncbi:hypothetical protein BO70DRAFT_95598 [Aspergillus heteromorphus CBS 117.55]|uniref:Uncharacterized protein n=1 Tax=Aspergillus heteromorphus CBS 117.55 TaxID=1448321 RepID=A0A317VM10_9EURO|nr:uncharacterized protein BO70DRAFT_95598 [Aspergillus heteromorphus CBS 117.55]PWY75376.1 hypothetical protein BO70DRAFT_95598 [Aspergillus heteromorphus CBS 117.55]
MSDAVFWTTYVIGATAGGGATTGATYAEDCSPPLRPARRISVKPSIPNPGWSNGRGITGVAAQVAARSGLISGGRWTRWSHAYLQPEATHAWMVSQIRVQSTRLAQQWSLVLAALGRSCNLRRMPAEKAMPMLATSFERVHRSHGYNPWGIEGRMSRRCSQALCSTGSIPQVDDGSNASDSTTILGIQPD